MTIALSLKVNDGVILASDSAATMIDASGTVVNVYNNANKVFNLRKGLPIGAFTWGGGSIGTAAISTLTKDFRRLLLGEDKAARRDWKINARAYTIEEVAQKFRRYMFDELYVAAYGSAPEKPSIGFVVAGYSSDGDVAEEYQILITDGNCTGPTLVRVREEVGVAWYGQPEALSRLVLGFSPRIRQVLETNLGVPPDQVLQVLEILKQALTVQMVDAAMPIQDAIDLAEYLVDVSIKFSRFSPGASTVGGPIEVAAITKHEGFKWIRRKHYYNAEVNPVNPGG